MKPHEILRTRQWRTLDAFLTEHTPTNDLPRSSLALFVMGNPFIELPKHAARLFENCRIGKAIVVTGKGEVRFLAGVNSEADFCKKVLLAEGIGEEFIITEEHSTNTLENVRFGMKELRKQGVLDLRPPPHTIVVVAIPPMLRRALATFRKQFPDIRVAGSAAALDYAKYVTPEHLLRIADEVRRLKEYGARGDIALVDIPPEIIAAAETVKEMVAMNGRSSS